MENICAARSYFAFRTNSNNRQCIWLLSAPSSVHSSLWYVLRFFELMLLPARRWHFDGVFIFTVITSHSSHTRALNQKYYFFKTNIYFCTLPALPPSWSRRAHTHTPWRWYLHSCVYMYIFCYEKETKKWIRVIQTVVIGSACIALVIYNSWIWFSLCMFTSAIYCFSLSLYMADIF